MARKEYGNTVLKELIKERGSRTYKIFMTNFPHSNTGGGI